MEAPVAIDIENQGDTITLVGVSTPQETWASEWSPVSKGRVVELLGESQRFVIAHNWMHELKYFGRYNIPVRGKLWDTMIAHTLLQPDLGKGLEKSVTLYADARPFKHLSTQDPARPAHDAYWARRMFDAQYVLMEQEGMLDLFVDTIMPAMRNLLAITERGFKVSLAGDWRDSLVKEKSDALEAWTKIAGAVNPLGAKSLGPYVKKLLGGPNGKAAKTIQGNQIARLLGTDHAPVYYAYKRVKLAEETLKDCATLPIGKDGCVHPSFLPASKDADSMAASCGRIVSHDPELPARENAARQLYVPHGSRLIEACFDSPELRVAAYLSADEALLQAATGPDMLGSVMRMLDCDRDRAGVALQCALEGKTARTATSVLRESGATASFSEEHALRDQVARTFPRFWAWRSEIMDLAKAQRWLRNPFGRKRHFYGEHMLDGTTQWMVESTASDLLWAILAKGAENVVAVTHNGLVFSDYMSIVMARKWPQLGDTEIPITVRTGPNWRDLT